MALSILCEERPLAAASSTAVASARIISPVMIETSPSPSLLTLTPASLRNGYIRLKSDPLNGFERQTEVAVIFESEAAQQTGPTVTFLGIHSSSRKIIFDRRAAAGAKRGSLVLTVHNY